MNIIVALIFAFVAFFAAAIMIIIALTIIGILVSPLALLSRSWRLQASGSDIFTISVCSCIAIIFWFGILHKYITQA